MQWLKAYSDNNENKYHAKKHMKVANAFALNIVIVTKLGLELMDGKFD